MSLYILKFGGSSLATIDRIDHVANIISYIKKQGHLLVVVTSAMQGVTDQLVEYARSFNNKEINREYDSIICCGEIISAGIVARALQSKGLKAKSFTSWQVPIRVTGEYYNANIVDINTDLLNEELENDCIPVITGFQGVSPNNEILTLGRGGSDATACALAHYMNADECLIYTDVNGIYTADPHLVLHSYKIEKISYDDMLELSKFGAKVMQYQSVKIAKKYKIKVRVLSSFNDKDKYNEVGTLICDKTSYYNGTTIAGLANSNNFILVKSTSNINDYNTIHIINNIYLISKSLNISNKINFDYDIGIITIVGKNIPEIPDINAKYIIHNKLSTIYIVSLSQIDFLLNKIHSFIFKN